MRKNPYTSTDLERRLLEELMKRGGAAHRCLDLDSQGRTLSEAVADRLQIPRSLINAKIRRNVGTPGSGWQNELDWTAKRLRDRGYLKKADPKRRGIWEINSTLYNTLSKYLVDNDGSIKNLDDLDEVLWNIKFALPSEKLVQMARLAKDQYHQDKTISLDGEAL